MGSRVAEPLAAVLAEHVLVVAGTEEPRLARTGRRHAPHVDILARGGCAGLPGAVRSRMVGVTSAISRIGGELPASGDPATSTVSVERHLKVAASL